MYLASLLFTDDEKLLVTVDENIPIIEVDDNHPSTFLQDLCWLMKVQTLRKQITISCCPCGLLFCPMLVTCCLAFSPSHLCIPTHNAFNITFRKQNSLHPFTAPPFVISETPENLQEKLLWLLIGYFTSKQMQATCLGLSSPPLQSLFSPSPRVCTDVRSSIFFLVLFGFDDVSHNRLPKYFL